MEKLSGQEVSVYGRIPEKLGSPQMVYLSWEAGLPIPISCVVHQADEDPVWLCDVGMEFDESMMD